MNKERTISGIKVVVSGETYDEYKGTLQEQLEEKDKEIERLNKERSKTYENGLNYFLELQKKKDEIERLNNIIKEVREYIDNYEIIDQVDYDIKLTLNYIREILDKGE